MERYLEIGACSMLDYSTSKVALDKMYHSNKPEYYSNLFKYCRDWLINVDLNQYSGFIFSQSIRDRNEYDNNVFPTQCLEITELNVVEFTRNLSELLFELNHRQLFNRTIVLIDSVSVERTYKSRPFYAATKSYQAKLFEGMALNNPKQIFVDVRLGSVKTRMCNHGIESSKVAEFLYNKLTQYKLSETNYIIDHL